MLFPRAGFAVTATMESEDRMSVRRSLIALALLASATAVLSCGEPSAPPQLPPPQASMVASLPKAADKRAKKAVHNAGLLKCDPTPTTTATATIGSQGGVIRVGSHTLDIPAGALHDRVTITAVAPADTVDRIQFQPEGLVFRKPAALTMSYANCDVSGSVAVQIAHTDDALVILEYLPSLDRGRKVIGQLEHFSNYAVAW